MYCLIYGKMHNICQKYLDSGEGILTDKTFYLLSTLLKVAIIYCIAI